MARNTFLINNKNCGDEEDNTILIIDKCTVEGGVITNKNTSCNDEDNTILVTENLMVTRKVA